MVMKWVRTEVKNDPESALKADDIEEASENYNWFFLLKLQF
jgi:hypothetical protein